MTSRGVLVDPFSPQEAIGHIGSWLERLRSRSSNQVSKILKAPRFSLPYNFQVDPRVPRGRAQKGVLLSKRSFFFVAGLFVLAACRSSPAGLEKGTQLPSVLDGAVMRNAPVEAAPPAQGWVVYVFSPEAPESARNSDAVERLSRSLPPDWVFLSVATESKNLSEFMRRVRPTVPVLSQVPDGALTAYRVTRTPRTYVLDSDWKLLEVIDGVYQGEAAKQVAARFKGSGEPLPAAGPVTKDDEPVRLCRDPHQGAYSRGAKARVLGRSYRCGEKGVWVPSP